MPRIKQAPLNLDELDTNRSYSIRQVADAICWHPGHLRRLIRQQRVDAFRPNGHEWRIQGTEVKRMAEALAQNSGVLGLKMPPEADFNPIAVNPGQMSRIEPTWEDRTPEPTPKPARRSWWDAWDAALREGNPLLFDEEEGEQS